MRYLVTLADRTSFYLSESEGIEAMKKWSNGENIFCRRGAFAYHLISSIRPLKKGTEEHQAAVEEEDLEKRRDDALASPKSTCDQLLPPQSQ